jgi:glutaminyl-tRNA synthetase
MDDTNPTKEEVEYVESIERDVRWLIAGWADQVLRLKAVGDTSGRGVQASVGAGKGLEPFYASDYFEPLYQYAEELIRVGKAYVCDLTPEEVDQQRGAPDRPGRESPFRNRSAEENLDLFRRMRAGEFPDGSRTLRAKIDMASPNINLRDPVMYRILRASHHRTGDRWCIYPMYDWAHGQSDSIEGVTHSLCDLTYEDHRPLYDWFVEQLGIHHPRQIEFARLNLTYTVLSKRFLRELVEGGYVSGWDDPRMPTLCGLRRRGYTPEAIRALCRRIGVAKTDSIVDIALLEHCVREDLNRRAPRVMAVLHPLKIVIENYPEGKAEELEAVNNPEDPAAGTRRIPFSRVLYIERDDFRENPPNKFFRLAPGREVRLRYSYIIKCTSVVKDPATGRVVELRCTYDPASLSAAPGAAEASEPPDPSGAAGGARRVKATLHWVSAEQSRPAEVRIYDSLFLKADPTAVGEGEDWKAGLNPNSLEVLTGCRVEPGLADAVPGSSYQFERLGYFCVDSVDSSSGRPVFNRTVTLRDRWAKIEKAGSGK